MTSFLLMGIVLTNAYKGIVITDITAPLKVNHISTIDEAIRENYTLVTPSPENDIYLKYYVKTIRERENLTVDYVSDAALYAILYKFGWLFGGTKSKFERLVKAGLELEVLQDDLLTLLEAISAMMDTWKDRDTTIFVNGTGYEFLKCNKTLLVDTKEEIAIKYLQMNQLGKLSTIGQKNNKYRREYNTHGLCEYSP